MPLYEYKCKECEEKFEVLQKINAEPLKKCIYCQGEAEKLVSISSFQFKGSGWYITDYKNKSSKTDSPKNQNSNNKGSNKNASINK